MTIFYHASNEWFKQPKPEFVQKGTGHDTNGQGLYLARNIETAQKHIERQQNSENKDKWKDAIIYVTDIEEKNIYNPCKSNEEEFDHILQTITKVTGKPIPEEWIDECRAKPQNINPLLYRTPCLMGMCKINKRKQNKIYHKAGYVGHAEYDEYSICLTDPNAYPNATNWGVYEIIGNGPHNMPASIKNKYTQTSSSAPANNPIPKTNNKIP